VAERGRPRLRGMAVGLGKRARRPPT
jgi:hypothetical protein